MLRENLAFHYWVFSLVFLAVKMYSNSLVQAVCRVRNKKFTRPDDAAYFGQGSAPVSEDIPIVQRASACWRNDLENIPIFLLIALAFALAGGPANWMAIYALSFCISRLFHMFFYLRPRQPYRSIMYGIGSLSWFVMAIHTLLLF